MKIFKNISELSDQEIIDRYKKNEDKNLVGELYKRYTKFVFLISIKYLGDKEKSEDIVMQIFEKLFDDLLKHEITNFKYWLHSVTRNTCLLHIRSENYKQKHEEIIKNEQENFMESETEMYQDNINNQINEEDLKTAIAGLKPEQKTCIELFYLHNKSYTEIVDITNYELAKVKSYIQNGKRNMKIILEKWIKT